MEADCARIGLDGAREKKARVPATAESLRMTWRVFMIFEMVTCTAEILEIEVRVNGSDFLDIHGKRMETDGKI